MRAGRPRRGLQLVRQNAQLEAKVELQKRALESTADKIKTAQKPEKKARLHKMPKKFLKKTKKGQLKATQAATVDLQRYGYKRTSAQKNA